MDFQHILFPTDLSELSRSVEPHVRRMADLFHARVTVLHAVEPPTTYYGVPGDFFRESPDSQPLLDIAKKACQKVLTDLPVTREVEIGDPAAMIAGFAEANDVDLIMMPTHGYGPFRRALIGSVTAKVLHDVHVPVWTTAHAERPPDPGDPGVRNIICGIELKRESTDLIPKCAALAKAFNANVWIAHAVTEVHPARQEMMGPTGDWTAQLQEYYVAYARKEIDKLQASAGTDFPVCLEVGPVAVVMRDLALRNRADLMVTGRGEIQQFLGSVRSHEYPIIHESPCPVLSF